MVNLTTVTEHATLYDVGGWKGLDYDYKCYFPDSWTSFSHEKISILDYLDQEPGLIDRWPSYNIAGFSFNPVIHYSINGDANSVGYQLGFPNQTVFLPNTYKVGLQLGFEGPTVALIFIAVEDFYVFAYCTQIWGGSNPRPLPEGEYSIRYRVGRSENGITYGGELRLTLWLDPQDPIKAMVEAAYGYLPRLRDLSRLQRDFPSYKVKRKAPPVSTKSVDTDVLHKERVNVFLNPIWNDMASEAYDSVEFGTESNGIMYAVEYAQMAEQVQRIIDTFKINSASKMAASLFLSFHYGWKLTLQDTIDMIDALEEDPSAKRTRLCASVRQVSDDEIYRYTVYTDSTCALRKLLYDLQDKLDACLTLENVWDMVPFSFVVDWILPIGEKLNAIDHFLHLSYSYEQCFSCRTWLKSHAVDVRKYLPNFTGNLTETLYTRQYGDLLQPSIISSLTPENPITHLVEGSSLILANTSRPNKPKIRL